MHRSIIFELTVLAALMHAAAPAGAQVLERGESVIVGRVTERGTGDGVADASVRLVGLDRGRTTGENGRFEILDVPSGTYVLQVSHIAYETVTDTIHIGQSTRVELDIQLVTATLELEPIVVVARYPMRGNMAGFYRRRSMSQVGHFFTRVDIEERPAASVSAILRRVPGVRVVQTRSGGLGMGNNVVMRGNCKPAIFIDGILTTEGGLTIDEMLQPRDIEGIEVYRGTQTPPGFQRNPCGAVLFWTRPGGETEGRLPFWKGALIGGALAVLAFILAR